MFQYNLTKDDKIPSQNIIVKLPIIQHEEMTTEDIEYPEHYDDGDVNGYKSYSSLGGVVYTMNEDETKMVAGDLLPNENIVPISVLLTMGLKVTIKLTNNEADDVVIDDPTAIPDEYKYMTLKMTDKDVVVKQSETPFQWDQAVAPIKLNSTLIQKSNYSFEGPRTLIHGTDEGFVLTPMRNKGFIRSGATPGSNWSIAGNILYNLISKATSTADNSDQLLQALRGAGKGGSLNGYDNPLFPTNPKTEGKQFTSYVWNKNVILSGPTFTNDANNQIADFNHIYKDETAKECIAFNVCGDAVPIDDTYPIRWSVNMDHVANDSPRKMNLYRSESNYTRGITAVSLYYDASIATAGLVQDAEAIMLSIQLIAGKLNKVPNDMVKTIAKLTDSEKEKLGSGLLAYAMRMDHTECLNITAYRAMFGMSITDPALMTRLDACVVIGLFSGLVQ